MDKDKVVECSVILINRESKKGNKYSALQIVLPNGYQKTVFLDSAEKFIFGV